MIKWLIEKGFKDEICYNAIKEDDKDTYNWAIKNNYYTDKEITSKANKKW